MMQGIYGDMRASSGVGSTRIPSPMLKSLLTISWMATWKLMGRSNYLELGLYNLTCKWALAV